MADMLFFPQEMGMSAKRALAAGLLFNNDTPICSTSLNGIAAKPGQMLRLLPVPCPRP